MEAAWSALAGIGEVLIDGRRITYSLIVLISVPQMLDFLLVHTHSPAAAYPLLQEADCRGREAEGECSD